VGLKRLAATTVSATMALAHAAGIRVFATGGIGGAHRSEPGTRSAERGMKDSGNSSLRVPHSEFRASDDISADLVELGRTPVLVVCAGAKSILDLPRTLEILETLGVPVLGYRTEEFPAFYVSAVKLSVSASVETAQEAAAIYAAHVRMGGRGAVLARRCPDEAVIPAPEFHEWLCRAEEDAQEANVRGPRITPFLLSRIAELSRGRTLIANRALIVANARLAAEVAVELTSRRSSG
jgi:pseudouridine-5'-phosphate glycosidase